MRSNGHNRVEHLFGLATAQIVDPIRFPRARLEVGVLDGYLLPGPQQPAKTGLAGLDHDDLSAAACAGLWPSLKGHRRASESPDLMPCRTACQRAARVNRRRLTTGRA